MNKDNRYCVYMHISPSGKKYIGITQQNPLKRWQKGNGYRNNPFFTNAIRKYGWDSFDHCIISENLEKEKACTLERYYIALYQTTDRKKGYNIGTGGEHGGTGSKRSKEQKKHFAEITAKLWRDKEYREKILQSRKGYICTEEHRKNISRALKGHTHSEETKEKIGYSLKHSEKFHQNRKTWNKRKHYTDEQKEKYKSAWSYTSDETKNKIKDSVSKLWKNENYRQHMKDAHIDKGCKRIICVELNRIFNSLKEAEKETGVKYHCISKCCHGIQKTAGTYQWKFI